MKIASLINKLKEHEMKMDEFGRLTIEDCELMEYVTGAGAELTHFGTNSACGSNGACGNSGCGNARCK